MCGRFTITLSKEDLKEYLKSEYDIHSFELDYKPNYNVAPGEDIISIIYDGKKNRIGFLKWGFIPPIKLREPIKMINAKAETIFSKPSFKESVTNKRCVILADSFYEWQSDSKTPFRIQTENKMFAMAGIYNSYYDENNKKINTVLIITTNANQEMLSIHQRMPVILTKENEKIWLNKKSTIKDIMEVLIPYQNKIIFYPVSKRVNSTKNNESTLIDEIKKV